MCLQSSICRILLFLVMSTSITSITMLLPLLMLPIASLWLEMSVISNQLRLVFSSSWFRFDPLPQDRIEILLGEPLAPVSRGLLSFDMAIRILHMREESHVLASRR